MGGRSGQSVSEDSYGWGSNKSENARILASIAEKEGYVVEIQAFGAGKTEIAIAANGKIFINKTSKLLSDPEKNMAAQHNSGWLSTGKPEGIVFHEISHLKFKQHDNFYTNTHRDVAERVSRYARRNPKEFVAEAYAGLRTGKKYDAEVMNLYRMYSEW